MLQRELGSDVGNVNTTINTCPLTKYAQSICTHLYSSIVVIKNITCPFTWYSSAGEDTHSPHPAALSLYCTSLTTTSFESTVFPSQTIFGTKNSCYSHNLREKTDQLRATAMADLDDATSDFPYGQYPDVEPLTIVF